MRGAAILPLRPSSWSKLADPARTDDEVDDPGTSLYCEVDSEEDEEVCGREEEADDEGGNSARFGPDENADTDEEGNDPLAPPPSWTTIAGLADPDEGADMLIGRDIFKEADETATSKSSGDGVLAEEEDEEAASSCWWL